MITAMLAVLAAAVPYGPAPDSLTWRQPPDAVRTLAPGQMLTLPKGSSDLDVWSGSYRLRQRGDARAGGYCFTRAHGQRCLGGYVRINRDLFNLAHTPLRVYTWKG